MSLTGINVRFPLLRIAIMLIIGIMVGDQWGDRVPIGVWTAGAAVILMGCFLLGRRHQPLQGAAVMGVTLCLGAALLIGHKRLTMPVSSTHDVVCEAFVMSQPVIRGKVVRCDLAVVRLGSQPLRQPLWVRATVLREQAQTGHHRPQPRLGDALRFRATLQAPATNTAGNRFDFARWMRIHQFRAQIFITPDRWQRIQISTVLLPRWQRVRRRALLLRQQLLQRYSTLGLEGRVYAVVAAMTLGDKSRMDKTLQEEYSVTGASHVLALSGLHLGIIYSLLSLLTASRGWRRWLSQLVILVTIWSFAVIVGMPQSVVRAATMLTVYSVAWLAGRQKASVNTLAFAAIVMLCVSPLMLWDVGFQLSFAAVAAILVLVPLLRPVVGRSNRVIAWLWDLTVVSLAAQIGTAPLVAYHFGRMACYGLLANFVVIPAATFILYGAVAMVACTHWLWMQQLLAQGIAAVTAGMNAALATLSHLPLSSIDHIHLSTLQLLLIYVAIASCTVVAHYLVRAWYLKRFDAFSG